MDDKKLMAILDSITFGALPDDLRPNPAKRVMPEAYPDYGKSLVTQGKGDPITAGVLRGLGYGGLGALIGGGAGHLMDQSKETKILMAILGGLLGGGLGFYSGKKERESDNSRLLSLRRLGIQTPGELAAASDYPTLARKLTDEGIRI